MSNPARGSGRPIAGGRTGYTLLELMLALALLGALMTVAWSLMGTYRDAEQRGWKLSNRVQIARAARDWLQSDLQRLAWEASLPGAPQLSTTAGAARPSSRFIGDASGFSASLTPALDPLPFLERLMDTTAAESSAPLVGRPSMESMAQQVARRSPWPVERVTIEYRLAPLPSVGASNPMRAGNGLGDFAETQYVLTRRELVDVAALPAEQSIGFGQDNASAERVLTAQDLYRQHDDPPIDQGAVMKESRLPGLVNVQFMYCNGAQWLSDWNSESEGGLPQAVALSFDFPARADVQRPEARPAVDSLDDEFDGPPDREDSTPDMPFADSALAASPMARVSSAGELGIVQGATSQVQIVVLVEEAVQRLPSMGDGPRDGGLR